MNLFGRLLWYYQWVFFIGILLTWIPMSPGTFLYKVHQWFRLAIDPVLRPIRKVVPPVRIGNGLLDLSPFVVFFGIQILIALFGYR